MTRIYLIASFWSYEYSRIMIWHSLNFEHFKNLENLEDLENLKNLHIWVLWTFWELTCRYRSILSSDLGFNSFESCFQRNRKCQVDLSLLFVKDRNEAWICQQNVGGYKSRLYEITDLKDFWINWNNIVRKLKLGGLISFL